MIFKSTYKDQYVQDGNWPAGIYSFQAKVKGASYSIAVFTDTWEEIDLSWQVGDGEWREVYVTFASDAFTRFSLAHVPGEVLISEPMLEKGNNLSTPSVSPLDLDEVSENTSERVTVNFDVLDDRINANVTAITTVTDDVTGLTTRVSDAEADITLQAGIIEQKADKTEVTALGTTVTSLGLIVDAHTGQIASKVSQTEYNEFGDQVSSQFSQINQRAGDIEISVSSLDEKVDENKGLSEAYADSAAASAESAAKSYAEAKAEAERVIAEAYADGIVDAEEQARIDDVNAKLAAAKAYAEAQDAILKDQQEDYADQTAAAAIAAAAIDAQNRAEAQALWAKTEAGSYTDGEITTLNNQLLDTGINIQQQLITITSDKTIFRDNQGNPIALFNPSWTKIQASAIELEGLVTVNSKFKVLLDGSIEAVDGKFTGQITANEGTLGTLTMQSGGYIDLPPTFTSRKGRLDNDGLSLIYDGSNSQKIDWYSGLGTFAGQITCNSQGRLRLSSSFGIELSVDFLNYSPISIMADGLNHKVDFGGAELTNMRKMSSIGQINMAYTTHALYADTKYHVATDATLIVITSAGSGAGIYRITGSGNSNPSNGDVKIITNAVSGASTVYLMATKPSTATYGSNIKVPASYSGSDFNLHENSSIMLVYYGGYWRVQTDWGQ